MDRRSLLLGGSAALTTILCAPAVRAADRYYNHYVTGQAEQGLTATHVAKSGDTWDSLFGERVEVARFYNRQNLQLETGQLVLLPPEGITDFMSPSMAPLVND